MSAGLEDAQLDVHETLVRQWVDTYYDPELFSVQQVHSALAILD